MTFIARAWRGGLESDAVDAEMTCEAVSKVQLQAKGATFGQAFAHTALPRGP